MHVRSTLAIARKDALDIILNKSTFFLLLTPIILAIIFVVIGALLGSHTTNALIYDPGKSNVEQVVDRAFPDLKVTYVNSPNAVSAAFGPDGSSKSSSYALGLIVPDGFDTSLRSGDHPQLSLYIDGSQVNDQARGLLLGALTDYTRSVANPQPPASISLATINPPSPNSGLKDVGQIYAITALMGSLFVGTSMVPSLLVEEKEKKTLRMLMVSPASFADVVLAKLLVGLVYQLALALIAVAITGGFNGSQVPLLLLFAVIGSCFSVALGLLVGSLVQTTSASGAFSGTVSFIYILPAFFVGPLAQLLGSNPFTQFIKILPTYYIADGTANAVLSTTTAGQLVLDVGISVAAVVLLLLLAVWMLRRQATLVSIV